MADIKSTVADIKGSKEKNPLEQTPCLKPSGMEFEESLIRTISLIRTQNIFLWTKVFG